MKKRWAFTLIELLVVVAVIAVLIAILLPSLNAAKKRANTTVCMANERALTLALRTYVQDWNASISGNGHGGQYGAWDYQLLNHGLPQSRFYSNDANIGSHDASNRIRFCPDTMIFRRGNNTSVGTANLSWDCRYGIGNGSTGSYGINDWVVRANTFQARNTSTGQSRFWDITKSTQNEGQIPVFADCVWHDFLPQETDTPFSNLQDPEQGTSADRTLGDACMDRHARGVNVSFLDLRVETIKLPDLWTLKWSASWTRSAPQKIP